MYLKMAEEDDQKMAESWKADADGILIFVRFNVLVLYFDAHSGLRLVYSPLRWRQ